MGEPQQEHAYRPLIYQMLHASSLMLKTREHYAAAIGVSPPQFSILTAIGECAGASVGEIAARLHVSGPFATTQIGKLVRLGLVRKEASDRDQRVAVLFLTDEGEARLDLVAPTRLAANRMIFDGLSFAELERLSGEMQRLIEGLTAALHMLETPKRSR